MNSQTIALFLVPLVVTLALVPGLIWLANRTDHISIVDFRRQAREQIPVIGGLAMAVAFIIGLFVLHVSPLRWLLFCVLPIFFIGFIDDRVELKATPKLLCQVIATLTFLSMQPVQSLVLVQAGLTPLIAIVLSAFWMIGTINAINMIDGQDGLAGGVILIIAAGLTFLTTSSQVAEHLILLMGVCTGFLCYNRPRAKIYLGDAGSTSLGFLLAAIATTLPMESSAQGEWLIPLFLFAHPCGDACLAILRRWRLRVPLMTGDHDHLHHKIEKIGMSPWQGLAVIYGVNIYCVLTSATLLLTDTTAKTQLAVAALAIIGLLSVLASIFLVELRLTRQVSKYGHSLLDRSLKALSPAKPISSNYTTFIFDLRPYYQELHRFGLLTIESFVTKLTAELRRVSPDCMLMTSGEESLVVRHPESTPTSILTQICADVLSEYRITKTASAVPLGITVVPEFIEDLRELDNAG